MVRVVAAGHVNWDVTLYLDRLPDPDGESRIRDQRNGGGGSAANVAAALSALGIDTGLVGSVGDDEHGHLVQRELAGAGVDCEAVREVADAATTVKYLLVADGGEVSVLGNDGANEAVGPGDVDPDYVRAADHVHLTGQRPDTAARIAEVADEADITVSVDPGRRLAARDFSRPLALADVVFLNEREAETADAAAVLEREDCLAVLKHGAEGAEVRGPDGTHSHGGFGVEPEDTSGAGDAFAAGFLSSWLTDGDVDAALRMANACGALAAASSGARTYPTDEDVASFLADRE